MINDRQKVTDDLARLTQQIRGTARELAPTQPAASEQIAERARWHGRKRSGDAAATQLGLAAQRRISRIRSESALTSDLQKLGQQIGDAARALGSARAHFRRMRRSIARWTICRVCAIRWRASAEAGSAEPRRVKGAGRAGTGAGRRRQSSQGQQLAQARAARSGSGQGRGNGGQGQGQGGQQGGRARWSARRSGGRAVRSATGSRVRWAIPWRAAIATATGTAAMTPVTPAFRGRPWRRSKVRTRPIRSVRLSRD